MTLLRRLWHLVNRPRNERELLRECLQEGLPVELVYEAAVEDRSAALREELRIKRLDRRAKLALIADARS